mmetsp:Transcript_17838/g.44083  ORF Transcript_17838/g.44083 Transcript_17838/m.44083 type:complete len:108 (+) Transcript_17838:421-744(+)
MRKRMGFAAYLSLIWFSVLLLEMNDCTATRARFATSPTSDQKQSSCFQRPPVGLDYYPSIQAHCPPPVIDQDQWVADILVSWLNNNQTDGFWHPSLPKMQSNCLERH